MNRIAVLLVLALTIPSAAPRCQDASPPITARMMIAPGALAGPGPSDFAWSPRGSKLSYVAPLAPGGPGALWLYDAASGSKRVLLDPSGRKGGIDISSAQWSPRGDTLLLSGMDALWLLDAETGLLASIAPGGSCDAAAFLPSGAALSFVRGNDLYMARIRDGAVDRLTFDGSDTVYNGTLDWVYDEEFATRVAQPAYAWSPDGKWLLALRTDDGKVPTYPVVSFATEPPAVLHTRYPRAGSVNPEVSLHLLSLRDDKAISTTKLPENAEYILPFFRWAPDSSEVFYSTVSRDHRTLTLKAWNPSAGTGRSVIVETDLHWINEFLYSAPLFLRDGSHFLWLSERNGFMHIYLYSLDGRLLRQLTAGDWLVDTTAWDVLNPEMPVQVDPEGKYAFFSTTRTGPLDRQLSRLNLESGELTSLSQNPGFHFGILSADGRFILVQSSDVDTPPVTTIVKPDGEPVVELGRCAGPTLALPKLTREFLTLKARDGVDLYAQIVKPENFDPAKKYGVVIHWYGGPTLQLVSNRYGTATIFNHIERDVLYTQAGFIVWRLDNRGSMGRGHAFETPIAGKFGPAALDDQLAGVEYLASLPYVDAKRIGTDGKSFGGFLTLYALIHAPEVFRCGVAGSGPTDWRDYDTIYTERYMGTPQGNPEGYAASNIISRAAGLRAPPLLIHGLVDTNVHARNTIGLIAAMMALDRPFSFLPLPNSNHHYGGDDLVTALSTSVEYFKARLGSGASGR